MAKAIGGTRPIDQARSLPRSLQIVWSLRLVLGAIALLGAIIFLLGGSWDIQWHTTIGRDRTLIPPHIMMLIGVGLSGIAGLAGVIIETLWIRQREASTRFAQTFYSSLGAYIVGFAALNAAIAFPLDSYWHSLYGIDVAIWAPFHIMFLAGMSLVALGSAYMLLSAANLATRDGNTRGRRAGYIGAIIAFAVLMGLVTLVTRHTINFGGGVRINVYPLLLALFGGLILVAAVYAIPWHGVATLVTAIYLLFALAIFLFVPPVMDLLVRIEQQAFRANAPHVVVVSFEWAFSLLAAALVIDIVLWFARRKAWSPDTQNKRVLIATLLGFLLAVLCDPLFVSGLFNGRTNIATLITFIPLTLLGAYGGYLLGRSMGETLHTLER